MQLLLIVVIMLHPVTHYLLPAVWSLLLPTHPPNGGFTCVCSISFHSMYYTVQYWNPQHAEWRGCGVQPTADIDVARKRMRGLSAQCHHTVSFRLISVTPA